uniref:NADH dehydrogenase subunit 2 n=1 Tax=Ooencyrtus plautus TaxID=2989845 RepID=UPI002238E12D|nr:NADH dehydrogenase subunit 2 [Ooencyrtus plautus]UYP50988.1 NADH dehydrogenase subunit 2 [Ooencyrtus plautus]
MYLFYYFITIPVILSTNLILLFMNSNFFIWMIMEINMICFISILTNTNYLKNQFLMNYFLIQSLCSYIFLWSSIFLNLKFLIDFFSMILIFSMNLKMGMPPLYHWYLKFMKKLNWMNFFLNSCIQKFIPLFVISKFIKNMNFFFIFFFYLIFISPLMSLKMKSLKLILSMSSIIQMLWIILMMNFNEKIWMLYFLFYCFITFFLILIFKFLNLNYLFQLTFMKNSMTMIFMTNFLIFSLASVPPFTGFLNKLMFVNITYGALSFNLLMLMMLFSLINFYFYSRIMIFNSMFFYSLINKSFNLINYNLLNFNISLYMIISIYFIFMFEMF